MKALTLTDYIEKKQAKDVEFSEHYIREQTINNIAEMIVAARKKAHYFENTLRCELTLQSSARHDDVTVGDEACSTMTE